MTIKLPLFLAVGLSVYMSLAHAQLIEYTYTGHNLNPTNNPDDNQRITINFTIDDLLISPSGHFNESFYYEFMPKPNEVSPFQSFLISNNRVYIHDIDEPNNYADYDFNKINVIFDTDLQGNIINWNITGENYYQRHGATWDYKIESIFDGSAVSQQDIYVYHHTFGVDDGPDGEPFTETRVGNTVPGTWTRTVVPLPGSLVLFGSGLLAFLFRKPKGFVAFAD